MMLVLGIRTGQSIRLIDRETNQELGIITRIRPRRPDTDKALMGFDFSESIQIIRDTLTDGKETGSGQQHE